MEMKPEHIGKISCEVVLFNRQRFRLYDRTIKRVVYSFSGNIQTINTKKLANDEEIRLFFNQIKSIYLNKKIVANRGCPELPLKISNYHFGIIEKRQILFKEAEKCYRTLEKKELNQWCREMRKHYTSQQRTAS